MTQAWMVRISEREDLCFSKNIVAIGWANVRGADQADIHWSQFKQLLRDAHDYKNEYALGQAAGSVWRFVREIKISDLIVAPTYTGLNIARVVGAVSYEPSLKEQDSAWHAPVKWLRRDIPRDTATGPLQARCMSRQTCVEASDFIDELERLAKEQGKPNIESALLSSAAGVAIGEVLDSQLTPTDLEDLVGKLLARNGAKIEKPPKNFKGKLGDVDVIARYDFPPYTIGVQVKKHQGETDYVAVKQILDAMDDPEMDIDVGCVVSTATRFSDEAVALAEERAGRSIRLVSRVELVSWLLSAGIAALR